MLIAIIIIIIIIMMIIITIAHDDTNNDNDDTNKPSNDYSYDYMYDYYYYYYYRLASRILGSLSSGQNISHRKSRKWNSIGKCHWQSTGNFQWKSTGKVIIPLTSEISLENATGNPLEMPLKIHDDFWCLFLACNILHRWNRNPRPRPQKFVNWCFL